MPWNTSIQNQIKDMDISKGGTAIRYQPVKVSKADKPLLFIGLGGTGLRIGRQIKDMFIERFKPATNPKPGLDERLPANTRFLAVDTDEEDMKKLGYQGIERCSIGDEGLAARLMPANRHLLPAYINEWLNPNLISRGGNGIDGAQGVRQIGRLDLFTKVNDVIAAIQEALTQVMSGTGKIQVVIAAGVAGGTGAGTFMDIPYLVRHVANQLALTGRLQVMGILVTPDVYAAMDASTAGIKRANGYAGLKELDYWMEPTERRHDFVQQYTSELKVKWDVPPFDDCILISGQTVTGGAPEDAYTTLRGVVAEYITNLFAEEIRNLADPNAAADNGFSLTSYRSNVRASLVSKNRKFDVSRNYTVIGASNGQIPLQEMVLNESIFLFNKVREYYDAVHTPDLYDGVHFADFVNQIVGNGITDLFAPITVRAPRDVTIASIRSSDHLAPHSAATDATVKTFMDSLESRSLGVDAITLISERVRMLEQKIVSFFTDAEKGPFWASRFIDATPGEYNASNKDFDPNMPHNFDLVSVLTNLKNEAQNRRNRSNADYEHQVKLANTLYNEIKTNLIPPLQNGPTAQKYYSACETAITNKREYYKQDTLYRLYDAMLVKLDEMSKQIIKPLCKSLLSLCETYKEIDQYMTTPAYRLSRIGYYSDIVDPDVLLKDFTEVYMTPVRTSQLVETLYKDMMRPYTYDATRSHYQSVADTERWIITEPQHNTTVGVNIRDNLQRVINDFFRQYNSNTLLEFWKLQYPHTVNPNGTLNLPAIVATLQPKMQSSAAPMFLSDAVYPITGSAEVLDSEYITVPQNAMGLDAALNPGNLKHVKKSEVADRIFWICSKDGVALHNYGALKECEQDYIRHGVKGAHIGTHLWETDVANWKDLPNPLPRAARSTGYNNEVQAAMDEEMVKRIDVLREKGKFTYDANTSNLELAFNTQRTLADLDDLCNKVKAGSIAPQQVKAELDKVLATRQKVQLKVDANILSTSYASHEEPLNDLIADMLMQRPAVVSTLEKDLADTSEQLATIDAFIKSSGVNETLLTMAGRLADLFAFGVLERPNPMHVVYKYGGSDNIIYNTMQDNVKYATRYHAGYAMEVCVAAKLMDMEAADHPNHGMLSQLSQLEQDLTAGMTGMNMDQLNLLVEAFQKNAPALKQKLDFAYSEMTKAAPNVLNMTAGDKQLCLDFLNSMRQAINARALGFGMVL